MTKLSRRSFLASSAGFTLALTFAQDASAHPDAQLTAYITIKHDGTVIIQAPAAEMGQGINTTIPLMVAEELDADWSKVKIEFSPNTPAFHHPIFRTQFTVASLSSRGYWMAARTAGAQARKMLMDAAAVKLKVPVAELTTSNGKVIHAASKKELSYGQIAFTSDFPATLPEIKPEQLKPLDKFTLLGKDVAKFDAPNKTKGATKYSIDIALPKMLYASVFHAPSLGQAVQSVNLADLKKIKGITNILTLDVGVAIVGTSYPAVLEARSKIKVEWGKAVGSGFNSEEFKAKSVLAARETTPVVPVKTIGDLATVFTADAKVISNEYTSDYAYHAQLEPLNAVASVTDKGVEIYGGTQWPTFVISESAKIAGVKEDKVKLHTTPMGGGFGRRAYSDYILDAVKVSSRLGVPVKVINSREEDIRAGYFRPMTAHKLDMVLAADGKIAGMRHRLSSDTVVPLLYGKARMDAQKNVDHIVTLGLDVTLYGIGVHHVQHVLQENGVRTAAYRGIGYGYNHFPIETMIDVAAKTNNQDPLAYRLSMIKEPRARALLEKVATMSDWGKNTAGRMKGLAVGKLGLAPLGESIAATVVEISVDSTGKIKTHTIWCAVDCGLPLQPNNIKAQVEGALIWGVSSALKERITIKNGEVEQQNYFDYEVLRQTETPEVKIEIIRSGALPLPVGELGLSTVPPAIANAFASLTGKHLRAMPFLPERVKAA